jgi:hypothetical protein
MRAGSFFVQSTQESWQVAMRSMLVVSPAWAEGARANSGRARANAHDAGLMKCFPLQIQIAIRSSLSFGIAARKQGTATDFLPTLESATVLKGRKITAETQRCL